MAEQHEENAYHRHNTSQFLYQLKQFSPEPNTAWDGPDPETDTFAWLREKEFREYNERKAAEWAKENPDWNAYDPAKDEFLHPHLDSGWRKKKLRSKVAKNAATRFIPKQQKEEKKEDDGDTVRVVRKGMALGCYAYDPLPKPAKDISLWIKGLKGASTKKEELAPNIDWNQKFATNLEKPEGELITEVTRGGRLLTLIGTELPLSSKTAKALFDFGMARARRVKMNEKKKEEMFLFLEVLSSLLQTSRVVGAEMLTSYPLRRRSEELRPSP